MGMSISVSYLSFTCIYFATQTKVRICSNLSDLRSESLSVVDPVLPRNRLAKTLQMPTLIKVCCVHMSESIFFQRRGCIVTETFVGILLNVRWNNKGFVNHFHCKICLL